MQIRFAESIQIWILVIVLGLWAGVAVAEDPWADAVVSYNAIDPDMGFDTPGNTVGEPVGGGTFSANHSSVHSVGRPGAGPGSYILLRFDTPVTDDAQNPMGLDCIVFSNCFWVGGNPTIKWQEPGLIEISEDVNGNGVADDPWYIVPGSRSYDRSVLPAGIPNPSPPLADNVINPNSDGTEYDWGYCELTPTQRKYLDNYVRPDDPFEVGLSPRSGGGDAFDIAWAVPIDGTGNPGGITQFHFIRISSFIDATGGAFGFITPEVDSVADVAPDIDTDIDGILDEYETRVANTDPTRMESTVLALEIPFEEGSSPLGTELGIAADAAGNAIRLVSNGTRSGLRAYNCIVDILGVSDPAPAATIPGLLKSGAVRDFQSSVADFQAAQVQDAELTIAYAGAEIVGLDEPGLQPFRFNGVDFDQVGISGVIQDTESNLLTFRSQYPGIFVLASIAGAGDIDVSMADIVLDATPSLGVVGNPGTDVTVTSDPILLPGDIPVPDGTFFTVATTLGLITVADADAGTPGVQVASSGGTIAFTLQGVTTAGTAAITAASLDGTLHGHLDYSFLPGLAVAPVDLFLVNPNATAPGPVAFTTSQVADEYGNPLNAGTYLNLVVVGGEPLMPDLDPGLPGHQIQLTGGVANFYVTVYTGQKSGTTSVTVSLYADPAEMVLLGTVDHTLDVAQVPLRIAAVLLLALCLAGVLVLQRRRVWCEEG